MMGSEFVAMIFANFFKGVFLIGIILIVLAAGTGFLIGHYM